MPTPVYRLSMLGEMVSSRLASMMHVATSADLLIGHVEDVQDCAGTGQPADDMTVPTLLETWENVCQ